MNIFQLMADALHLSSFLLLIHYIHKNKSVQDLSYRTQEMYLIVFSFRYLDLLFSYISIYNTIFKIFFISATSYLIYLIKYKKPYSLGYDPKADSFNHYFLIYPIVLIITIIFHVNNHHHYYEYLWSFSIWLEAFAIIP